VKTYKHSLSHYKMFSSDMGRLIPIQAVPVLPGDTMQGRNSLMLRMAPLNTPVMHPVEISIDTWFVPNRVVDPNWEDFITGQDATPPPTIQIPSATSGDPDTLPTYLDVGNVALAETQAFINAHPVRAYNLIYNTRYRDQDLATVGTEDQLGLRRAAWRKDYYNSARPFAQKGGRITIPVSTNAGTGNSPSVFNISDGNYRGLGTSADPATVGGLVSSLNALRIRPEDIRTGMALQRYQEARAMYGSRFTEYLRYLGITPSDSRLQEPELLGSGRGMVNFSEVLQTAPDGSGDGVGDLFGHGIAGVRTRKWRRFFEEHGWVLTLMTVRPKSVYSNITLREHLKKTKEDYFQRELVHIGQQPLWSGEVGLGNDADNRESWGWTDRYAEYTHHPSTVSGEFRDVLNTWHLARDWGDTTPTLNESFVECTPSERIFQSSVNKNMLCMVNNSLVARRLVPKNPNPRTL
jgi:hypothetical protein